MFLLLYVVAVVRVILYTEENVDSPIADTQHNVSTLTYFEYITLHSN
jgi:hypothetical protein